VALLHMLPEANEMLETAQTASAAHDHEAPGPNATAAELETELEEEEGGHGDVYPFAFLFAALGVLLMLFLEQIAAHLAEQVPKAVTNNKSDVEVGEIEIQQSAHAHAHTTGELHSHHDATLEVVNSKEAILKAYMIEVSIAIHSILVGVGLGVLSDYTDIQILLVALCFHQLFEGIALGGAVVRSHQSKWFLASLIFCFSFSCPVGVAIGAGIANSFNPEETGGLWTQGVLYSLACGTLLYIGLYDLMADSFQKTNTGYKKFWMVFSVGVGITAMSAVAVWA